MLLSEDLKLVFGNGRRIDTLKFRCSRCGSKTTNSYLRLPPRSGQTVDVLRPTMTKRGIIWHRKRMKFQGDR